MIMNDIYYKIGSKLSINNFMQVDIKSQKEMIDKELKQYIIEKISELKCNNFLYERKKEFDTFQLFEILANSIPKEQHFNTLRHFIHYILNIASSMQNWQIIWIVEERESLIECPEANFNENGILDCLITNDKTDYVKLFTFVYDIFKNSFLEKQVTKQIEQK